MDELAAWIEEQLAERGWRPADLVRYGGINSGLLSRILSGTRRAGPDTCLAIARAFREPPDKVFRLAGLLPPLPGPDDDLTLKEILEIVRQLTPDERREVLEYAAWRYRRQQSERGHATSGQSATANADATAAPSSQ